MMGPLHRFRDQEHLTQLFDAIVESGISIAKDHSTISPQTYVFQQGLGKILGSVGTEEWESMIYFGYGHPFNPLLWYSDGILLKKIEAIFLSQGTGRVHSDSQELPLIEKGMGGNGGQVR